MPRYALSIFLLLVGLSPAASADAIYQYTGAPFTSIFGNWSAIFGATPTEITAQVDIDSSFPVFDPFTAPGVVGGISAGNLAGVKWATISDGVRTFSPDTVFLMGYHDSIINWVIGGGIPIERSSSDQREITTSNFGNGGAIGAGDESLFQFLNANLNVVGIEAQGPNGTWALVTPEINTGGMALVSGLLLLAGYRRRSR